MTRKHYEFIAERIRTAPIDPESRPALAAHFADMLATTNPNFDRYRFIEAATRED